MAQAPNQGLLEALLEVVLEDIYLERRLRSGRAVPGAFRVATGL